MYPVTLKKFLRLIKLVVGDNEECSELFLMGKMLSLEEIRGRGASNILSVLGMNYDCGFLNPGKGIKQIMWEHTFVQTTLSV